MVAPREMAWKLAISQWNNGMNHSPECNRRWKTEKIFWSGCNYKLAQIKILTFELRSHIKMIPQFQCTGCQLKSTLTSSAAKYRYLQDMIPLFPWFCDIFSLYNRTVCFSIELKPELPAHQLVHTVLLLTDIKCKGYNNLGYIVQTHKH